MTIVAVLLYVAVVQYSAKHSWRPFNSSLVVVIGYFVIETTARILVALATGKEVSNFISLPLVVMLILQFAAGYFTFVMLERFEESLGAWFAWATVGLVLIFIIVPSVMMTLLN